jgi:hypothetical protein
VALRASLFALLLTATAGVAAPAEMRREESLDFAVDEAFQRAGGVQYFFALEPSAPNPPATSALGRLRPLDDKAADTDAYQVVMSRIVYTVERDLSYFTEARARDVAYLKAVAPEMGVELEADGSFVVNRTPRNRFRLTWLDAPAPGDPALARFSEFLPKGERPASIVVQKNSDFARVMGFRTAERAITYTAHFPLGPGRTRIFVCTLSLLYHVPPFFLGGRDRVFRESVEGAAGLIERLRDYRGN